LIIFSYCVGSNVKAEVNFQSFLTRYFGGTFNRISLLHYLRLIAGGAFLKLCWSKSLKVKKLESGFDAFTFGHLHCCCAMCGEDDCALREKIKVADLPTGPYPLETDAGIWFKYPYLKIRMAF